MHRILHTSRIWIWCSSRRSPIRLSAITAGGSQAVFFKVNTLGEESFLEDVKGLLEEILEE